MENSTKNKFQKWLELLQQESWQLELIISGFAIFLLLGLYEPLLSVDTYLRKLSIAASGFGELKTSFFLIKSAWYSVVLNLIVHVTLRGLWIATIGLRYVSQDIDFKTLKLAPRYDAFLKKRIVSFDNYIEWLEKICSVLFAFTFLVVFMWIALAMWLLFMNIIISPINQFLLTLGSGGEIIGMILTFAFIALSFVYFIDFVGMGIFKKVRELTRFYYPIYRFLNFITLAFIYRPLYYNLIDNKFGKWVGYLLVPYLFLILTCSILTYDTHVYLPRFPDGTNYLRNLNYEDLIGKHQVSNQASIPSKIIKGRFLELFLPYNPRTDDKTIEAICPNLQKGKKEGISVPIFLSNARKYKIDSALVCFDQMHHVFINDSLYAAPDFVFYKHPQRGDYGVLSILDTEHLVRGRHHLKVETQFLNRKDSLEWRESAKIDFWLE